MENKNYTYHKIHSFVDNGQKVTFISQLYQLGIYAIIEPSSRQFSLHPKDIVKMEKNLIKAEKKGEITELVFRSKITVSDNSGFWKEII